MPKYILETVVVFNPSGKGSLTINKSDFDANIHKIYVKGYETPAEVPDKVAIENGVLPNFDKMTTSKIRIFANKNDIKLEKTSKVDLLEEIKSKYAAKIAFDKNQLALFDIE